MKKCIKKICFILWSARLLPHYCVLKYKCMRKDVEALKYIDDTRYFAKEGGFFGILHKRPEYISVLYSRLQGAGKILSVLGPKYPFKMQTKVIGGGIYIDHPHYTHLNAEKIGRDFKTKHNVTIGNNRGGIPTIGDNVFVGVGAVVVGKIRIGNNVQIGANAVVTKDVPDNAVVVGNPAYIIRLNGERVNIKL